MCPPLRHLNSHKVITFTIFHSLKNTLTCCTHLEQNQSNKICCLLKKMNKANKNSEIILCIPGGEKKGLFVTKPYKNAINNASWVQLFRVGCCTKCTSDLLPLGCARAQSPNYVNSFAVMATEPACTHCKTEKLKT